MKARLEWGAAASSMVINEAERAIVEHDDLLPPL
jgi:hypothetical protein